MVESKTNYKFKLQYIAGAQYRLPQINFNQPPFTGKSSYQGKKPKDVYSENPNYSNKMQQQSKSKGGKEKSVMSHILCVPLNLDEIMPNYESLVTKVKSLNADGVEDTYFQPSNLLHVTLCSFDFGNDQNTISRAKSTLIKLQPIIQQEFLGASCDGKDPKPFYLTIKGLDTFQKHNATEAQVLYCDFVKDEGYQTLQKIGSRIIQEFVNERIVSMEDLSNVNYNYETQMFEVKFHMTMLKCRKSNNQQFNAKQIIDQYGDVKFGTVKPCEIQLNNIHEIDTYIGQRIKRTEKGVRHDTEGFYACDAKIFLNYD